MDRFIENIDKLAQALKVSLKSNMDRFIAHTSLIESSHRLV